MSRRSSTPVKVFETFRSKRAARICRQIRLAVALAAPVLFARGPAFGANSAGIQPTNIAAGSAVFQSSGALTTIRTSDHAIINYQQFNVLSGQSVQFIQPSATSTVLNRINGGTPSLINGAISANGIVYFANPAGVFFGPTGTFSASQVYIAAGNISDSNFLAGINQFHNTGVISNAGTIQAGDIYLSGLSILNSGNLVAPNGVVEMVSGTDVLLGESGGHILLKVSADKTSSGTGVSNTGNVNAANGSVAMAAGDMYGLAVFNSGKVKATNIAISGGQGAVAVSGTLDASSKTPGAKGGNVQITTTGNIAVASAAIDASGPGGGGSIKIGGDSHGASDLPAAANTSVAGSTLNVNATNDGNGGQVVVWSSGTTDFTSQITAMGAGLGAGGNAEISGNSVIYHGTANLTGPGGVGLLLFDPVNATISTSASSPPDTFNNTDLVNGLATGSIEIDASNEIFVLANVNASGNTDNNHLILNAPFISLSGTITLDASGEKLFGLGGNDEIDVHSGATINNAISLANSSGSLIKIDSGSYSESIHINGSIISDLTFQSNGGTVTATSWNTTSPNTATFNGQFAGTSGGSFGGAVELASGSSIETGNQIYAGAVAIDGSSTIQATSATLEFDSPVTGSGTLSLGNTTKVVDKTSFTGVTLSGSASEVDIFNGATINDAFTMIGNSGSIEIDPTGNYSAQTVTFSPGSAETLTFAEAGAGTVTVASFTTGANLTTILSGMTLSSTGAQTYGGPVQLSGADSLSATAIDFQSTLDGPGALTLLSATTTTFAGNVGSTSNLASLSTPSGDTVAINGNVSTTGAQTYGGAVTLGAGTESIVASSVDFQNTVEGPGGLALSASSITFASGVGDTTNLAGLTTSSSNTTNFTGSNNVTTTGAQTYGGTVNLGSSSSDVVTLVSSANLNFQGTIEGPGGAVLSSPLMTFASSIGDSTNLASFIATGSGPADLGGSVTSTGNIVFNIPVTLTNNVAISGPQTGFDHTVDGPHNLDVTITSAGSLTFDQSVGSTTALAEFSVNGVGGITNVQGALFKTSGNQTFGGTQLSLTGAPVVTLQSTGGAIAFEENISGTSTVTVSAPTTTLAGQFSNTFAGNSAVDAVVDVQNGGSIQQGITLVEITGTVNIDPAGTYTGQGVVNVPKTITIINTTGLTTPVTADGWNATVPITLEGSFAAAGSGNLSFSDLTLGAGTRLTTTSGNIDFGSSITGNMFDLSANSTSGHVTFAGSVFSVGNLSSNAALTDLNANITTTGSQTYTGPVTLSAPLNLTAGTFVDFTSTIDGADTLQILATPSTTFGGNVGGTTPLTALIFDSLSPVSILKGSSISTTSGQTYGGTVTLGTPGIVVTMTDGSAITFQNTIEGPNGLSVSAPTITFMNNVGDITPLVTLNTATGDVVNIPQSSNFFTTGDQTYGGTVNLGGSSSDVVGMESIAGNIVYQNTVEGPGELDTSASLTTFSHNVGDTTVLGLLLVQGNASIPNGTSVTSTSGQTYGGILSVGTTSSQTITLTDASDLEFDGTVEGPGNLVLSAPLITFFSNVGDTTPLASLVTDSSDILNIQQTSGVTTTGGQTYGGIVNLGGSGSDVVTFSGTGSLDFQSKVEGPGTFAIGGGFTSTTFGGNIGDTTPLASISTASTDTITLTGGTSITTTGGQTYAGTVDLGTGIVTFGGTTIDFTGSLNGAGGLAIQAGTTSVTFAGFVGFTTPLASITTPAGTTVDQNGGTVITSGAQTYGGNVSLSSDTTLTSTGTGNIEFDGTINGPFLLNVFTDATSTFQMPVGGTTPLGGLHTAGFNGPSAAFTVINANVTTSNTGGSENGNQIYGDNLALGSLKLKSIGGNIEFDAPSPAAQITGSGTVTVSAPSINLFNNFANTITLVGDSTSNQTVTLQLPGLISQALTLVSSGGTIDFRAGDYSGQGAVSITNKPLTLNSPGGNTKIASLTTDPNSPVTLEGTFEATGAGGFSFGAPVTIGAPNARLTADSDFITFGNKVEGPGGLTADSTNANGVHFDKSVGDTTNLASLNVGNGDAFLGSGSGTMVVTTAGDQTYAGAVQLTTNTVLTSNSGGITIAGNLDGANNNLTVDAAGNINIGNVLIDGSSFTSVTHIGALNLQSNSGNVTLQGNYSSIVSLSSTTFGQSSETILGAPNLSLGNLSATPPVNPSSFVQTITTSGNQTYTNNVQVPHNNSTTLASGSGTITFSGGNVAGEGNNLGLSIMTVTAPTIVLNSVIVTNTTQVVNNSTVAVLGLAGDNTPTHGNLSVHVESGGSINNAFNLISSSGTVTIDPGTYNDSVDAAGVTFPNASNPSPSSVKIINSDGIASPVTTTGWTQTLPATYQGWFATTSGGAFAFNAGAITLAGNTKFTSDTGDITFASGVTIDSAANAKATLDLESAGLITIGDALGNASSTSELGSLTVGGGGLTDLNLTSSGSELIVSSGNIQFNEPIQLTDDIGIESQSGNITFSSTIDGAFNLQTLTDGTGNTTSILGAVGGSTPLSGVTFFGNGSIVLGASVNTSGDQSYPQPVTLAASSILTGQNIDFAQNLTASNSTATIGAEATNLSFANINVGGAGQNAIILVSDGGQIQLTGSNITAAGNILFTGTPVGQIASIFDTASSLTIDSTGGNFTMGRGEKLTVYNAANITSFGSGTPADLNISAAGTATLGDLVAEHDINVTATSIVMAERALETFTNTQQGTIPISQDEGVRVVAGDFIDFSTVPTADGAFPNNKPTFAQGQQFSFSKNFNLLPELDGFNFRIFDLPGWKSVSGSVGTNFVDVLQTTSSPIESLDVAAFGNSGTIALVVLPNLVQVPQIEAELEISGDVLDMLQNMGVDARDMFPVELVDAATGWTVYDDLSGFFGGKAAIAKDRIDFSAAMTAAESYRDMAYEQVTDPVTKKVVRKYRGQEIKADLTLAWKAYTDKYGPHAPPEGLRAFLKPGNPARAELDELRNLYQKIEVLGLTPRELSRVEQSIYVHFCPNALAPESNFEKAINGPENK